MIDKLLLNFTCVLCTLFLFKIDKNIIYPIFFIWLSIYIVCLRHKLDDKLNEKQIKRIEKFVITTVINSKFILVVVLSLFEPYLTFTVMLLMLFLNYANNNYFEKPCKKDKYENVHFYNSFTFESDNIYKNDLNNKKDFLCMAFKNSLYIRFINILTINNFFINFLSNTIIFLTFLIFIKKVIDDSIEKYQMYFIFKEYSSFLTLYFSSCILFDKFFLFEVFVLIAPVLLIFRIYNFKTKLKVLKIQKYYKSLFKYPLIKDKDNKIQNMNFFNTNETLLSKRDKEIFECVKSRNVFKNHCFLSGTNNIRLYYIKPENIKIEIDN